MALYKDVSSLEVVGYTEPENGTFSDGVQFILEKLDAIQEVDVEPVRHGHWTKDKSGQEYCSACGQYGIWSERVGTLWTLFCPNCGAKMDGKEVDSND